MTRLSRREALALLAAGATVPGALRAEPQIFRGPPSLHARILSGELPPVGHRLPMIPRVIRLEGEESAPGRYGGRLRMLIGGARDIRHVPVMSYSRLVGYDRNFIIQPDILERFHVANERIFTFRLRRGHRWSDGSPLTAEDFRFAWEDIALHPEMSRSGPPAEMRAAGDPPRFEVLDDLTVRYSWDSPNPAFLSRLAAPVPPRLVLPAAYLRQFHADYQTPEELKRHVIAERVDDWVALMQKMSRQNRPENPALPTLEAWMPMTVPPADQFVFDRNPYFHRVDHTGQQLPYVDRLELNVSSSDLIPAKTGAGDSDLQMLGLDFADYTYLKQAEKRFPIRLDLWKRIQGSRMVLVPNLNCRDLPWRDAMRDLRFRRALSLGVDRHEINMVVFFGLAAEGANTVLPESPFFRPELATLWATHDPDQANRLLDEAGFAREGRGLRRLSDGRPMQLIVETTGESSLQTDLLQLIDGHWREIGIQLIPRVSQRDLFRSRVMAGQVVMAAWEGLDNGIPNADTPPTAFAPVSDDQIQWPLWSVHHLSGGTAGEAPDLPAAQELLALYKEWQSSAEVFRREDVWRRILELWGEQVFTIGTVNQTLQPVVRRADLRNMPQKALYGYDPTAYLGIYMPDTFWLENEPREGTA
ncbi:ABC transporter substrate-binding protein [Paracoccus sp. NGMCC 1.201697]|uniref:ABC transporter substrate-binding protein n=1 Tax=Paracoccus broussonetiae subsp. drimophilus TaxID=3373869 RepID=A0ABW7LNW2_9RHOB